MDPAIMWSVPLLQPFTGYVPESVFGRRVVGPPGATLTPQQREAARHDPLSFRHAAGRGAHATRKQAAGWLDQLERDGVLRPVGPSLFVYRQTDRGVSATGIIGEVSLAAYRKGRVKPHEGILAKTERKMVDYVRTTRIYGNPIGLAHRIDGVVHTTITSHVTRSPDSTFTTVDGVLHQLWVISGDEADILGTAFNDTLYITDGHHRIEAAATVARKEGRQDAGLPAGFFAAEEMRLRAFARCVHDPKLDAEKLIARLRAEYAVEEVGPAEARPRRHLEFGARIGHRYFRLGLAPELVDDADSYGSLDVNVLRRLILEPILGLGPSGKDKRLSYVADQTDTAHLGLDAEVWFLPYPAAVSQVMAVAESGLTMPPKSTWFQPKLPSGLVIRPIDGP